MSEYVLHHSSRHVAPSLLPSLMRERHIASWQAQGEWTEDERRAFLATAAAHGAGDKWGLFASHLRERVGRAHHGAVFFSYWPHPDDGHLLCSKQFLPAAHRRVPCMLHILLLYCSACNLFVSCATLKARRACSGLIAALNHTNLFTSRLPISLTCFLQLPMQSCSRCPLMTSTLLPQETGRACCRYQASAFYREVAIPSGWILDPRFRMTRGGKAVFVG